MKLLIIAALIAVCSAASLEHLEKKEETDVASAQANEAVEEEPKPEVDELKPEAREETVVQEVEGIPEGTSGQQARIDHASGSADPPHVEQTEDQASKDPFANIPQQAFDEKTGYIY